MNTNPHLLLTIDYELFGNGSGSIASCVVEPADCMIAIAREHQAFLTFFVEVLEMSAIEQQEKNRKGTFTVKKQLINAIERGHDAQLHLHPQWSKAKLLTQGAWDLNMSRRRISDLTNKEITRLLLKGKNWLESLLTPINNSYSCYVFRAGGWCIQPSSSTIECLQKTGFLIDSTVAPYFFNTTKSEWSDFRDTPVDPCWKADSDVCTATKSGIWEMPIATGKISRFRHLVAFKYARNSKNSGMAPGCIGSYQGPDSKLQTLQGKITKIMRLGHVMLDLSTMPPDVLIDITKQWLDKHQGSIIPTPIVAIAHTKNFTENSAKALNAYLEWATANDIVFSSYAKWLEAINDHS